MPSVAVEAMPPYVACTVADRFQTSRLAPSLSAENLYAYPSPAHNVRRFRCVLRLATTRSSMPPAEATCYSLLYVSPRDRDTVCFK